MPADSRGAERVSDLVGMSAEPLRVSSGAAPRGWEALWQRDVWCQSELPHGDLVSTYRGEEFIHFERIGQPWLKEAAKRWARARLLADTAPRTMSSYLVGIAYFSEWLAVHAPEVSAPSGLSRAVLEDYMLWVVTSRRGSRRRAISGCWRCAWCWRSSERTGWRGCRRAR